MPEPEVDIYYPTEKQQAEEEKQTKQTKRLNCLSKNFQPEEEGTMNDLAKLKSETAMNNSLEEEATNFLEESKKLVGVYEMTLFKIYLKKHFNTNSDLNINIVNKIKEIQSSNNLRVSGIVDKQTLEAIYLKLYAKNSFIMRYDGIARKRINEYMNKYANNYPEVITTPLPEPKPLPESEPLPETEFSNEPIKLEDESSGVVISPLEEQKPLPELEALEPESLDGVITTHLPEPEALEPEVLLNKSINIVGKSEIKKFKKFFELDNNPDNFVKKVKEIQEENDVLKVDGVIGQKTLEILNKDYYVKNETIKIQEPKKEEKLEKKEDNDDFNKFLKQRELEIKGEMTGYKGRVYNFKNSDGTERKVLPLTGDFHPTSKKTFDGGYTKGVDYKNRFIANSLKGIDFNDKVEKLEDNNNRIVISKVKGQVILRFYLNNNLHLAMPVSPGDIDTRTPLGIFRATRNPDKYHISSQFPEKNGKEFGGAVMPYAIHVTKGVWIHGSADRISGQPESHGCIRSFLYYQKELFEQIEKIGIWNYTTKIENIY